MNNEIKFLTPFKRMCMTIGTLPSSFYASMSYYESMVWLYEYLKNEVIPVVNNNSEVAQELQTAFTELETYIRTYFDNLDIQEEVNTKLDEMAEDGTLADLVAEYVKMQGQLVYNTVADMKTAENIQNGSFLKTYGYYSVGDEGNALYKARTITNEDVIDDMFIIALHDVTLVAELIPDIETNVKQLGAKGDDTTNDSSVVSASIEKLGYAYLINGTYKLNINYTTDIPAKIYGLNATLKCYNSSNPAISFNCDSITHSKIIKDLKFELESNEIGLQIALPHFVDNYHPQLIEISNIKALCDNNFAGKVIDLQYIRELNIEGINLKRTRGDDSSRTGTGVNLLSCMNLNLKDSSIGFFDKAVDISNGTMSSEGILIDNVEMFFNNYGVRAISNSGYAILSLRVINSMIDQVQQHGIYFDGVTASQISNNWFGTNVSNGNSITLNSTYRENYGANISNNTIWHSPTSSNSFPIVLNRGDSYTIGNTTILCNTIAQYNLYAIKITGSNAVSRLIINDNNINTSSSNASNAFINYTTAPTSSNLSNNIIGGNPYYDDNLSMWNNIGGANRKILTASDITVGSTVRNETNKYLFLVISASNSSADTNGRINISIGPTNATMSDRYNNKVYNGTTDGYSQTCTVLIPPYSSYAINKSQVVTINTIYGIYL